MRLYVVLILVICGMAIKSGDVGNLQSSKIGYI